MDNIDSKPTELWRIELDKYIGAKLVNPDHANRQRWVYQSSEYERYHTDGVISRLESVLADLQGKRILDYGCGAGLDSINLARQGAVVTGVDIDPSLIAIARLRAEENGVKVHFEPVAKFHWDNHEKFDGVICIDVVEHVEDPPAVLKTAISAVRKGGALVLSTPNCWAIANVLADPHWKLAGVTLMPRTIARWYVTQVRKVIRNYDVFNMINYRELLRMVQNLPCEVRCETRMDMLNRIRNPELIHQPSLRLLSAALLRNATIQRMGAWVYSLLAIPSWWILAQKVDHS